MHKTKHTAKGVRLGKAKGIRLGKAKDQTGLRHKARQGEAKARRGEGKQDVAIPSYYTRHTHMIVTIINQDGRR